MFLLLVLYALGLIAFAIHVRALPSRARTGSRIVELLLLYQIVFSLGLTSLLAFFGLTFWADTAANMLGWPASPFEQELANVNLAFGILGIMSIWLRGSFWIATIVGFSIWIFGDGIHHILEAVLHGNYTDGNIGLPLYTDLIVPAVLCVLLVLYLKNLRASGRKLNP